MRSRRALLEDRIDIVGVGLDERSERLGLESLLRRALAVVTNATLQRGERVVRIGSDLLNDRTGVVLESRDQTHPQGFLGVHRASGERELEGVALPDYARKADRPAPRAEEPERDAGFAVGRLGRSDTDVTREREFETATACGAVDLSHDDGRRLFDRSRHALAQACELGCAFGISLEIADRGEVCAGTERRTGTAEGDDRFVGVLDGRLQPLEGLDRQGVSGGGTVDRHRSDRRGGAVLDFDHVPSLPDVSKGLWLRRRYLLLMETADNCRRGAFEAVSDVEPPALREYIETTLEEASMVPGVLTIESAAATAPDGHSHLDATSQPMPPTDRDVDSSLEFAEDIADTDGIRNRAAGVQLIYEGLRLTRSLAHEEPWNDREDESDARTGDAHRGDLEILAADILVARGFYLLARTNAAETAVQTVQAFGRDQAQRREQAPKAVDASTVDANLERDILELAVRTGSGAVGETPTARLRSSVESLADGIEIPFPPAAVCLADLETPPSERSPEDHRATSATDP